MGTYGLVFTLYHPKGSHAQVRIMVSLIGKFFSGKSIRMKTGEEGIAISVSHKG